MIGQFLLNFFEHSISLPVFHDHSFELGIEFVINLFLHLTVHSLHELL